LSMGLHRNRLLALVAACALVVCAAAYSAHGFSDRAHENSHCDLCVHFSGSAGSQAQPKVLGKPVLVSRVAPSRREIVLPTRSPVGNHLPRGPPLLST
jgi:hypothetical protein